MIFFTSDQHFGHQNIAGAGVSVWPRGFRDFSSVQEMNDTLVEECNAIVSPEDILYHLGDFAFSGLFEFRRCLNVATIHLCLGNHDKEIRKKAAAKSLFTSVQDVIKFNEGKNAFFLSHYAHRVWPGNSRGVLHAYGHSHSNLPGYGKSMDVGVDAAYKLFGQYRPFSLEEVVEILSKEPLKAPDHHKPL